MEVAHFLIPLAGLLSVGFIVAFIWAVKGGQFDELDSPPHRMLFEDETKETKIRIEKKNRL